MKRVVYTCDKCGKEISHVAYSLVCYAEDVSAQSGGGISEEAAAQNIKQNMELGTFATKTEKITHTTGPITARKSLEFFFSRFALLKARPAKKPRK